MRIAAVSDTHLPRFGHTLPKALVDGLQMANVERILHAGDWTDPFVAGLLEAIAPVDGVAGNNDGPAIVSRFGYRRVVDVGGARLGLVHGHAGPGHTTPERARRAFEDAPDLDAIVFGHSHIPLVERDDGGRWLVNPGSPTDRRRQPRYSWALLRIDEGRIAGVELVTFENRSTT
jgi:uncharacterized protein